MNRLALPILLAATLACAILFAVWPQIDLGAASAFYVSHGFVAVHSPFWKIVRKVGYLGPALLLISLLLMFGLARAGLAKRGPSARSAMFLALTMALGPGLLVNVVLKDHSHRPRPVQTRQFGGPDKFRPWYDFDGACLRNCSFVSGEASAAFWTAAPALLTPTWVQPAAVGAALLFGLGVGALRLAFGGHYLSDVLFAGLFTLIIVVLTARSLGIGKSAEGKPNLRERG